MQQFIWCTCVPDAELHINCDKLLVHILYFSDNFSKTLSTIPMAYLFRDVTFLLNLFSISSLFSSYHPDFFIVKTSKSGGNGFHAMLAKACEIVNARVLSFNPFSLHLDWNCYDCLHPKAFRNHQQWWQICVCLPGSHSQTQLSLYWTES